MLDARDWGPRLRFSAPPRLIEEFFRDYGKRVTPFLVYGSGDFHHLSALWIRRLAEPFVLVSFDNHPDWDVRPPRWGCGGGGGRGAGGSRGPKGSGWGGAGVACRGPRPNTSHSPAE